VSEEERIGEKRRKRLRSTKKKRTKFKNSGMFLFYIFDFIPILHIILHLVFIPMS